MANFQNSVSKIRAGGMVQVIECWPSKFKAPNPNPSTKKKKVNTIFILQKSMNACIKIKVSTV
jgi:hypothetical protein